MVCTNPLLCWGLKYVGYTYKFSAMFSKTFWFGRCDGNSPLMIVPLLNTLPSAYIEFSAMSAGIVSCWKYAYVHNLPSSINFYIIILAFTIYQLSCFLDEILNMFSNVPHYSWTHTGCSYLTGHKNKQPMIHRNDCVHVMLEILWQTVFALSVTPACPAWHQPRQIKWDVLADTLLTWKLHDMSSS